MGVFMKKKRLGNTDLEITRIGLGTWAMGGSGWAYAWGPQDDEASTRAIHKALEVGINWIDTAAVYGLGHSEEVLGKAIAGRRDKVIIATKCGLVWIPGNPTPFGRLKAESVRKEIETSLKRLGSDYIDLYQIHWPNPEEDIEEGWAEISKHVKAGKIRYAGVSNFSVQQLERIKGIHPVASLQPPYSMLRRGAESELLPYCGKNGIGVIVYSPMQAGILSGKFTRERAKSLPDDDWRKNSPAYKEPELGYNLALVDKLAAFSKTKGRSAGELAVAWVNRRPEVTAAIVGGRAPQQVAELAGAADWDLSPEETAFVGKLLAEREGLSR
jgi:aryl-alcohol dehydrogenase-like predicted oxidoreductase